ncbi:MG2 domain-containing protein [Flammeovirga sp. SubArs3]|uniref:MG2 domain-containing protein n=1 Tax=Flammeovirga sp. SubArs3 TaxID=2995316 RepID=UPI00248B9172|nr:MG2 domain-containing protein [Flammeovirga sp. SubArs3]
MKKLAVTIVTLSALIWGFSSFQEVSSIEQLIEKINNKQKREAKETIYIHTDKPYYMAGETIWFKAYLRNYQSLKDNQVSKTIYVELLDETGEIVEKEMLYAKGQNVHGDFKLSTEMAAGEYRIRAYTNWMRNFGKEYLFEERVNVFQINPDERRKVTDSDVAVDESNNQMAMSEEQYDLQFFAESGHLLASIPSRIGFKLVNSTGKGQPFSATVFASENKEITKIQGNEKGMGSLFIAPFPNEKYYAVLDKDLGKINPQKYYLPVVESEGVSLKLSTSNANKWMVQVIATDDHLKEGMYLLATQRGKVLYMWNCKGERPSLRFAFPTDGLNNGVVKFTLLDKDHQPILERNAFRYLEGKVALTSDKDKYKKREKVALSIQLKDDQGNKVAADASMSIVDDHIVDMDRKKNTILSELLFSKEIKGNIEDPMFYFNNFDVAKIEALDNLMLTQGYEKVVWMDDLNDTIPPVFIPEFGASILGQTTSLWNKDKTRMSEITMAAIGSKQFIAEEVVTDENGKFAFTGMVFFDTTEFVFQAKKYNNKKKKTTENRNVDISLYGIDSPKGFPIITDENEDVKHNSLAAFEKEILEIEKINRAFDSKTIILDEIEIVDEKIEDEFDRAGKLHSSGSVRSRLVMDSLNYAAGMDVWSFLQTDPKTAQVLRRNSFGSNTGGSVTVDEEGNVTSFSGEESVPVILDGFEVDIDFLRSMQTSELSFIEVLDASEGSLYMSNAINGVIALYSRDGSDQPNYVVYGINSFKHPGFYVGKEFYSPKYDVPKEEHIKPDHRITLLWEPYVTIDSTGTANIEFYTDDKSTRYHVEVEGIDSNGEPFYSTYQFDNN